MGCSIQHRLPVAIGTPRVPIPHFGKHRLFAAMQISGEVNIARTEASDYWSRIKLENESEDPAQISTTMLVLKSKCLHAHRDWNF